MHYGRVKRNIDVNLARKHLKLAMNIYIFMKFEYYHLIYVRTSRVTFFYWLKFHDTTIYDFGIDQNVKTRNPFLIHPRKPPGVQG